MPASLRTIDLIFDNKKTKCEDGTQALMTIPEWEEYFAEEGKRLPTLGEYIAAIKYVSENDQQEALDNLICELQEDCLLTTTKIDYELDIITHPYPFPDFAITIPKGSGYLDELVKKSAAWRGYLSALLSPDGVGIDEAIEALKTVKGARPFLLGDNKDLEYTEVAVCIYISNEGGLGIDCKSDSSWTYPARGVQVISEAAAAKKITLLQENNSLPRMKADDNLKQDIYSQSELEYARRLLAGIPSGTVMDLKK
jgi:hypothetical protein